MFYFRLLLILAVVNLLKFLYDFFKKNSGKKLEEISKSSWVSLGITAVYSLMVFAVCLYPTSFFRSLFFRW